MKTFVTFLISDRETSATHSMSYEVSNSSEALEALSLAELDSPFRKSNIEASLSTENEEIRQTLQDEGIIVA